MAQAVPIVLPHATRLPRRRTRSRKVGRMTAADDGELMLAYARGDLRSFELLYARYRVPLYRYLVRQTHDRALADDLFQETWSKIITARERYSVRAKFQTFLFHVAHNCFLDNCRRSNARPQASDDPDAAELLVANESDNPEQLAQQSQRTQRLRHAVAALPAEQRDVFLMFEESGLSLDEIATATGVGVETAKSRLRYAVAKLRSTLGSES